MATATKVGPQPRIPRIIHQIFFAPEMPAALAANVERLKAMNPGWEHRLYDASAAEDFIARAYNAETLAIYRRINPEYYAGRADLLRYLVIYSEGGVYLDIKTTCLRPLKQSIRPDDTLIYSQWRNGPGEVHQGFGLHPELADLPGGEFQNFYIMAAPRHPVLAATIARVLHNIRSYRPWSAVGRTGTVRTTGPIPYTQAILEAAGEGCRRCAHEEEAGIAYSVPNYDPGRHYSEVTAPVVTLGPVGTLLSRGLVRLREMRRR